jgi:hypothetical protein
MATSLDSPRQCSIILNRRIHQPYEVKMNSIERIQARLTCACPTVPVDPLPACVRPRHLGGGFPERKALAEAMTWPA